MLRTKHQPFGQPVLSPALRPCSETPGLVTPQRARNAFSDTRIFSPSWDGGPAPGGSQRHRQQLGLETERTVLPKLHQAELQESSFPHGFLVFSFSFGAGPTPGDRGHVASTPVTSHQRSVAPLSYPLTCSLCLRSRFSFTSSWACSSS